MTSVLPGVRAHRSPMAAGLVYLAVLAVTFSGLLLVGTGSFDRTFRVTTEVPSVGGGLPVGSDVKLRGLRVGRVSEVSITSRSTAVTMDLDPVLARQVPAAVQSRIATANIFGVPFVELVPAGPEAPTLREHAVIEADTSAEAVELAHLYETAYDVMVAIEPAKLNTALTAIASAVEGNGDELGALITDSASYLADITPHTERFEKDLVMLARILDRTDAAAPDLLDAIDDGAHLARLIAERRDQLAELLAVGVHGVDTAQGLLDEAAPRLINLVRVSAPVFSALGRERGSTRASLLALGRVAANFVESYDARGGITVRANATMRPFPTYSAADCPRYGSLEGPNCSETRPRQYAGSSASVGTPEEAAALESLSGDGLDGIVALLAGPALRGQTVVTR